MLGKIVHKDSRGTMFGAFSLSGSIGVLLINKLGGYLYDHVDRSGPFIFSAVAHLVLLSLLVVLGLLKKLRT